MTLIRHSENTRKFTVDSGGRLLTGAGKFDGCPDSSLDELPFAARNLPTALTKAGAPDPHKKSSKFFEFSCDLKAFFCISCSAREKKDRLATNQQGFRNLSRRSLDVCCCITVFSALPASQINACTLSGALQNDCRVSSQVGQIRA
jgi:hypothetical protein